MTSKELKTQFPWLDQELREAEPPQEPSGADVIMELSNWYERLLAEEQELDRPRMDDNARDYIRGIIYDYRLEGIRDCANEIANDEVTNMPDQELMDEWLDCWDSEHDFLEEWSGGQFANLGYGAHAPAGMLEAIRSSEAYKRHEWPSVVEETSNDASGV